MVINQERLDQLKKRQDLTFEEALYAAKCGEKLKRAGWKNVLWIALQKPDEHSKMKRAYFYACPLDRQFCPFAPAQSDLLSEDWQIVKE